MKTERQTLHAVRTYDAIEHDRTAVQHNTRE